MSSFPGLQEYFDPEDVLFDERPWAILKTDKLAGYMAQVAVVGHKCDKFDVVQFLDEEDSIRGECWWCKTTIPEGVQGLWQMLNWENLPKMRQYETDGASWAAIPVEKRFEKTTTQVDSATHANQNSKTSCTRNPKAYKAKKMCSRVGSWAPHKKKQSIVGRYKAP